MKKVLVRHGVFETNSSSCHSVSVATENTDLLMDTLYPNEDGIVVINGGKFGRYFERHNDAQTKASYAATSTLYGLDAGVLKEVILEQTGAEKVLLNVSEDYSSPYSSYIDHESTDVCPRGKKELRDFIFNPNSWLFIAHDEGTPEPGFYDALPVTTKDGVVEPKYQYEFKIPVLDVTYKLLTYPNTEKISEIVDAVDFRYNSSIGKFEINAHYSSGRETYYEPSYYIKPENGVISLTVDNWRLNDLFTKEVGKSIYSAEKKETKKFFKNHPEYIMYVNYQINEIN